MRGPQGIWLFTPIWGGWMPLPPPLFFFLLVLTCLSSHWQECKRPDSFADSPSARPGCACLVRPCPSSEPIVTTRLFNLLVDSLKYVASCRRQIFKNIRLAEGTHRRLHLYGGDVQLSRVSKGESKGAYPPKSKPKTDFLGSEGGKGKTSKKKKKWRTKKSKCTECKHFPLLPVK